MVDFVWLGLWALAGWLIGILVYFIAGFFIHITRSTRLVNKVANHYSKVAMKLLGRGALVERGTSYDIYQTTRDGETPGDKFTAGGQTAHVTNESGMLSTLHKHPFGLVPPPSDDVADYVVPEVAELGAIEADRTEHGELRNDDSYDGDVTLPEHRPLVQLREYADRMIPGSRSLHDINETVELYKQSQRLFGESRTTQFMILIIAYCAAAVVSWVIMTQGGGAIPDGNGVSVGLGGFINGVWL